MNNSILKNLLTEDLKCDYEDVRKLIENNNYSYNKINKLKKEINKLYSPEKNDDFCIFLVGSYGRLEASQNSDLDCIFISKNHLKNVDGDEICTHILRIAEKNGIKNPPGDTGTFKEFVQLEKLLENIGGRDDTNKNLTRRSLILTESHFLYNEEFCKEVVSALFNEYTKENKIAEKYPRVLINELVRYYKTITLDYRYKTEEEGKFWGVRNFKLRHSRKFLFFTSIAIIFTAMNKFDNTEDQYNYILENINSPPILKLKKVFVENEKSLSSKPFIYYSKFLEFIGNEKILEELDDLDYGKRRTNNIFLDFKKNSDEFNKSLKDIIKSIDGWDDLSYKYIIF